MIKRIFILCFSLLCLAGCQKQKHKQSDVEYVIVESTEEILEFVDEEEEFISSPPPPPPPAPKLSTKKPEYVNPEILNHNTEGYQPIVENDFKAVIEHTFNV